MAIIYRVSIKEKLLSTGYMSERPGVGRGGIIRGNKAEVGSQEMMVTYVGREYIEQLVADELARCAEKPAED